MGNGRMVDDGRTLHSTGDDPLIPSDDSEEVNNDPLSHFELVQRASYYVKVTLQVAKN